METLNFSDILELTTVNMSSVGTISWVAILANLLVSLMIGIGIALTYRKAFVGILFQKSFAIALVLTALVTTMVIMVISGNLVLSLGMVGALSIVRFRAAIKDPIDIVYMFWAIGVGIANGVGVYSISIISSVFISITLFYISRLPSRPKSKLVVVRGPAAQSSLVCEFIEGLSAKTTLQKSFSRDDDNFEAVYELQNQVDLVKFTQELSDQHTGIEVRVLSYTVN
jgi:uncharacterized membrane protein YhiD involved in acid resistance